MTHKERIQFYWKDILNGFKAGKTYRSMSEEYNVSIDNISKALRAEGFIRRPKSARRRMGVKD